MCRAESEQKGTGNLGETAAPQDKTQIPVKKMWLPYTYAEDHGEEICQRVWS